ncbi:hypothetical protein ZIOFF_007869 [Zingiber officinale]|uniref:Uncharacterized protein n=1 Tax=Zingiber officinale TaxID=94328 RepID=A0A8J5HRW7_ZINOF|nr:hypothetical protein ZIOFF_007869 [Zingiber officinale]
MAKTNAKTVPSELSLKLLIDTTAQKVLFAEAGKEVVDFLFGLLSLPVGSVVKLLSKDRMEGSIGNLYKSIQELDDSYLQNSKGKSTLLNPIHSISPSLLLRDPPPPPVRMFTSTASIEFTLAAMSDEKDDDVDPNVGFVKGVVTYTIMDDLTVTPMSSISSITLLIITHAIRDLEWQALEVLEISLRSKKVLTGVFLGKK